VIQTYVFGRDDHGALQIYKYELRGESNITYEEREQGMDG